MARHLTLKLTYFYMNVWVEGFWSVSVIIEVLPLVTYTRRLGHHFAPVGSLPPLTLASFARDPAACASRGYDNIVMVQMVLARASEDSMASAKPLDSA